jgi:hypothetical protein
VTEVGHNDEHIAGDGWSYACQCIRCRWEQWWNEGDNFVIPMPDEPHPGGDFDREYADRDLWSGLTHPNSR